MRRILLSIAVLSALSLPGLASAQASAVDTDNRAGQPGVSPKGGGPGTKGGGWFDWNGLDPVVGKPKGGSPKAATGSYPTGPSTGRR